LQYVTCVILPSIFFFTAPATPEIYTLSLHDALPISTRLGDQQRHSRLVAGRDDKNPRSAGGCDQVAHQPRRSPIAFQNPFPEFLDRKSTRLNSSHVAISYAVFCLKKKKNTITSQTNT